MNELNTNLLLLVLAGQKVFMNDVAFLTEIVTNLPDSGVNKLDIDKLTAKLEGINDNIIEEYEDLVENLKTVSGIESSSVSQPLTHEQIQELLKRSQN